MLIESASTWPQRVLEDLQEAKEWLLEFHQFEKARPRGSNAHEMWRLAAEHPNPQYDRREELLQRLEVLLRDARVLCSHATRLTRDEIDEVRERGLLPFTVELYERKLREREAAGDLSADEVQELRLCYRKCLTSKDRVGVVWGTLGRTALANEDELGAPMTYWGGEAMLTGMPHPPAYYRLGVGCIVEFHVPAARATRTPIQEAFVNAFLASHGVVADDGVWDVCYRGAVPRQDIIRIITAEEPEFEELTQASTWKKASPYKCSELIVHEWLG